MIDSMEKINQEQATIINTKKTVDWLVHHTSVRVFNPITFEGYQRQIDQCHCEKIVDYLLNQRILLPTAIICATDIAYSKDTNLLYIVDGQHRVEAFKRIMENYPTRYKEIREMELPVIVLDCVGELTEINTFITINKTAKKVDTSLALVLRNKVYNPNNGDMSIPKRDYIAVEVARALNGEREYNVRSYLWQNKIRYEGTTKNTYQLISLNAFVKSFRSLLLVLEKKGAITLNWECIDDINNTVTELAQSIDIIWQEVNRKWPEAFEAGIEQRRIVQGSIGFTAINRYLGNRFKSEGKGDFVSCAIEWIWQIRRESNIWFPGEKYSQYSSEKGFSIIAQDLYDSCF